MGDEWDDWNAELDEKKRIKRERREARRLKNSAPEAKEVLRLRGIERQKQGARSEELAKKILKFLDYKYINRVKTYYSYDGRYAHKAEADWRAINKDGKYTLVEVKDIEGDRLQHSRLEGHQIKNLNSVDDAGGESLLIITHKEQVAVLYWPVHCAGKYGNKKFESGTSILFEHALEASFYKQER